LSIDDDAYICEANNIEKNQRTVWREKKLIFLPGDSAVKKQVKKQATCWRYEDRYPNSFAASLLRKLFTTFEDCETLEAKVSHDVDSAECRAQAVEYARRYKKIETIEKDFLAPEPKIHSSDLQNFAKLLSQELATSLNQCKDISILFVLGIPILCSTSLYAYMSLGGPGVGKGTQCKLLARKHDLHHISVGELLDEPSPFS